MQLFHMQTAIFLSLLGLGVMERKVLATPLKSTEFKTLSKLITTVLSFGTQLLFAELRIFKYCMLPRTVVSERI